MKIVVIGPNNSGKGSLIKKLGENGKYHVFHCSKVLKDLGNNVDVGKLLGDNVVNKAIKDLNIEYEHIIFDGYPRTIEQAKYFDKIYGKPDLVIVLNITEDEILNRASSRRVCECCGEIYNLNGYKLPKIKGKCDFCGANLYQRADDLENTVKDRYYEYLEKTYPIVNMYKYQKCKTIVWEFDTTENLNEIAIKVQEYLNFIDK